MVESFKSCSKSKSKTNVQKAASVQGIKQTIQSYLKKTRSDNVTAAQIVLTGVDVKDCAMDQASYEGALPVDLLVELQSGIGIQAVKTTLMTLTEVMKNLGQEESGLLHGVERNETDTDPDLEQPVTQVGTEWADAVESQNSQEEQQDLTMESVDS